MAQMLKTLKTQIEKQITSLEHAENTFSHIAFTQMHNFFTARCKNLFKSTQICVIYTNLGRREPLVDH